MKTTFRSLLIVVLLIGGVLTSAAQQPRFGAPKDYVLVLGDSLAFGYQRPKFLITQNPANFTTGFADDFTARVRSTPPGRNAVLVNLGCPSESTNSFLTGPCAFHAVLGWQLHINYEGSQIAAAEAFLATYRGQVGPILISLAANDVFAVSDPCGGLNTPCFAGMFPALLANLSANYTEILGRLRRAAPDAEIITLGLYNPFAIVDPSTNVVAQTINQLIQQVAAVNRARFANPFIPINLGSPQPLTLCTLTLVCAFGDIHPTDLGYAVIADLMWEAAGYTRFEH
jgi:lysophospholipase L1-like esterase